MFSHYIRGGQTTMHLYRMFSQINQRIMTVALMGFLVASCWLTYQKTTPYGREILLHYYCAKLHQAISGDKAVYQFPDPAGRPLRMSVGHFLHHPTVQAYFHQNVAGLQSALVQSGIYTTFGLLACMALITWIGSVQKRTQDLRGALFLKARDLKVRLKKAGIASDILIAGMPLVKNSETQHILLTGTTGTGKTLYLLELMDNIRRRKERAIVYDIAGTFVEHFYREDRDIILNPFDEECPHWNIWQDGRDLADFEAMAASLMPTHLAGHDPFWIHSARTIFATLAERLGNTDHPRTAKLLQPIFSADLSVLGELLKGSAAETLVSPSVEKMALSIKSTLSTYCKSLLYVKEDTQGPLFSIKRWIQQEKSDGWLLIATNAEKLEALKPLISVWLDTAARSILTLMPSYERRLWLLIDELASLHRLPSLSLLLSQGRKYGLCSASAFQDIHQIRTIYGRDEAEALFAMYNTHVLFRTQSPETAVWMSRLTGQRERLEQREGFSYGANDTRDAVSIHSERRQEPLILETEFLHLKDKEAYVVLPGDAPITHIELTPKKRNAVVRRRVLRAIAAPRHTQPPVPTTPVRVSSDVNLQTLAVQVGESVKPLKRSVSKPKNGAKKAPLKVFKCIERDALGKRDE